MVEEMPVASVPAILNCFCRASTKAVASSMLLKVSPVWDFRAATVPIIS